MIMKGVLPVIGSDSNWNHWKM